jgi:pimeloyl-ACP methyl ester carboxylesterase
MIKNLNFTASDGEKISITTYLNESRFSGNSIIFVHGFKGFKDWGFGPYLADYLANKGFFTITFNFSHNGIGENISEFSELDKFSKNTFSREVRELNEIITAFGNNFFDIGSKGKLGLIGHSRGGAISILTAAQRNDVNAVALWASISKLDRYSERQKIEWRKKGVFEVLNTRTNQVMRLGIDLLDDIEKNSNSSLSIEKAVKNLNKPLLIAHGDQDLAIKINEAEEIYGWADKSKTEFFKLFGTGHTFDIVHPFAGSNEKFEKLLNKTSLFFKNNFN